jgi:predicted ATP-grasp superfamily ATP-dependent carboligase
VKSAYDEAAVQQALGALKAVGYAGIANLNFKRNSITKEHWLLEINPRVSQWNILASHCGINLPYIAYRDAYGMAADTHARQTEGVFYLNLKSDLRALRIYRQEKNFRISAYLRSWLSRPMIYQTLDWRDPWPFACAIWSKIGALLRRIA